MAQTARTEREIGVTAALNPNATGTLVQSEPRLLEVGVNVFANERIVTTADGQAQMLFVDESAFTVGPNSDVVLDEFVFDPETGTGRIALSATKGVFRLVGGRISKRTPVTLTTPTAVIGIRGGIALVNVQPGGETRATFLFGNEMTVESAGVVRSATRPGFAITAVAPQQPPSEPAPAPPAQLAAAITSLEGSPPPPPGAADGAPQPGQPQGPGGQGSAQPAQGSGPARPGAAPQGGPRRGEIAQRMAGTGLADTGSRRPPSLIAPPTFGAPPPPPPGAGGGPGGPQPGNLATNAQQNNALQQNLLPTISGLSGRFKRSTSRAVGTNDELAGQNVPFQGASLSSGIFSVPLGSNTLRFPVAAFGASDIGTDEATSSPLGAFSGNVFLAPQAQFLVLEALSTANPANRIVAFAGRPTASFPTAGASFYAVQDDFGLASPIPFLNGADVAGLVVGESEDAADAAIYWDVSGSSTAQRAFGFRTISITGQGASQKSAIALGGGAVRTDSQGRPFIDGGMLGTARQGASQLATVTDSDVASVDDGLGNDFFGSGASYFALDSARVDGNDQRLSGGASRYHNGAMPGTYFPTSVVHPASATLATRSTRTLDGYVAGAYQTEVGGSLSQTTLFANHAASSEEVTIRTSAAANKVQARFRFSNAFGMGPLFEVRFGDADPSFGDAASTTGESAFIDDTRFAAADRDNGVTRSGMPQNLSSVAFVSVSEAGEFASGFVPAGVSVCECQYLTWGFWGGRITNTGSVSEIIHLANFVTGEIASLSAIGALQGSATYRGHAIGTVLNGGQVYQAIGGLAVTVNFDNTAASTFAIDDFDGADYGGTGLAIGADGGGHKFTGSFSGAGRSGSYVGSFMSGAGDAAAEMGGQFLINGGGYSATGVFAGAK